MPLRRLSSFPSRSVAVGGGREEEGGPVNHAKSTARARGRERRDRGGDLSVPGAKKKRRRREKGGFCVQNLAVKRHVGWGRKLGQSRWGRLKEEAKLAEAAPAKRGKGTVERGPRERAQLYSSVPSLYLYLLSAVCTVGPPPAKLYLPGRKISSSLYVQQERKRDKQTKLTISVFPISLPCNQLFS